MAPTWIELGNEVESDRVALERRAAAHGEWLRAAFDGASRALPAVRRARWAQLQARHAAFLARHAQDIDSLNRNIDRFNLCVPSFALQRDRVRRQEVLARLAALLSEDPLGSST